MACSTFNFETSAKCTQVDIGFDFSWALIYKDSSGAIDLTNFVVEGEIKDAAGGTSLIDLAIVGDDQTTGFYIPDPSSGVIQFQIKSEDNSGIEPGNYPYEIRIMTPNGDTEIFMQGFIQFYTRGF